MSVVGVTGFEPATSWSQTRRSTKLSYTPPRVMLITSIHRAHAENCKRPVAAATALPTKLHPARCARLTTSRRPAHPESCLNGVAQVGAQPFFHHGKIDIFSFCIVLQLIASNLADCEIFRLGMRKIKPANARARMHRKRFR